MADGDTIHRAASALRTALAGTPMVRFDAPLLAGPTPQAGRIVERVECRGRRLEIEWDDGLILETVHDTTFRRGGTWHLYRRGDRWRKPYSEMSASIEVDDWVAVCFGSPVVETHRRPDRRRHPGMGRLGPDVSRHDADLGTAVNLLLSYPVADARLAEVLLDQRVMRGVGNVFRCEVLWATELSPFAPVGALHERDAIRVVNAAASLLRANHHRSIRITAPGLKGGLAVYGRNGQRCVRCGGTIDRRCRADRDQVLYWCPGCQVQLDRRAPRSTDDTPMDPHPAAQRWLAELPWNRDAG